MKAIRSTLVSIAAVLLVAPAAAQTSSWNSATDSSVPKVAAPAVKSAPKAKTVKQPAHAADPLSRFQKRPVGKPADRLDEAAPTAEDAAQLAFDKGEYLTALTLAGQRAKDGDASAHMLIARIYDEGLGVDKDAAAAAQWYGRAVELGDVEAAFALGVMLAEGRGVAKDYTGAARMFERAARTQHTLANYNLALLFLSGKGKPENPNRAAQHLEFAAQKGIAAAQYDLATLYLQGHGVKPDAYEASRWLRRAAEQGMAEAEYDYAVLLLKGSGINADMPRAIDYLKSAANKGLAGAQNRLAHVYNEGVMVLPDPVEAAKWRIIAREAKIADAALDGMIGKLARADRDKAERAAQAWRDETALELMR